MKYNVNDIESIQFTLLHSTQLTFFTRLSHLPFILCFRSTIFECHHYIPGISPDHNTDTEKQKCPSSRRDRRHPLELPQPPPPLGNQTQIHSLQQHANQRHQYYHQLCCILTTTEVSVGARESYRRHNKWSTKNNFMYLLLTTRASLGQ